MHSFKNVLFATRKPQGIMNYEIVQQAEIILKPVPTTLHCPQADFGSCGTRASVKPLSNPVSTKHIHCTLKSFFL
jgi:hypothetical protein